MRKLSTVCHVSFVILFLFPSMAFSQVETTFWTSRSTEPISNSDGSEALITARHATYLTLDYEALHTKIFSDDLTGFSIELSLENGRTQRFKLEKNTLMAPGLNEKFTEVKAFNIVSTTNRSIWGKFEISPKGIHAMIFQPGKSTVFVDPLFANDHSSYIAYAKKDFYTDKVMDCQVEANPINGNPSSGNPKNDYNDCQLHTYRLALAATGEYTVFQGGSAAEAFDAMVTTMNRVNGIYERDFAVTMVLVENTDELIYTDPSTDPYTNGSPNQMINENQSNVDGIIGSENYDIGHVFGTNSGGLAGLGVTCFNGSKARGVTGSGAPIGDSFDIDYVAHEMGHEFGGDHSFNNSCGGNRNNSTAVEPGSGTTIMGYAGICPPDIQQHSDDYFHGINMEEIGIQISENTCQVNTPLDNNSPQIAELPTTIYIPVSTPFALTGHASDVDGDSLTYCWEGRDNAISTQPPVAFSPTGPNFRSLTPVVDSTRYFPNLQDLANGGPYTWERIPSVARTMKFRLTVRDNVAGGGCTQYEDLIVSAVEGTGPFEVLYPSDAGIEWNGLDYETVTWDVANTLESPINADLVDIFLSTDGGDSYPIQLADDVENVGSFAMQVPNISTFEARIMVMNSAGTFFDISNNDFTINSIEDGFTFATVTLEYTLCQNETASLDFSIVEVGNFSDPIDLSIISLPLNAVVVLSADQANVGDDLTISINSLAGTDPGVYPLTINGTNGSFSNQLTYTITVVASNPVAAQPSLPEDNAANTSTDLTLEWENNVGPLETYGLQVATDVGFTNLITNIVDLEENSYHLTDLAEETTYYWRIINSTACAESEPSQVFSFTTFTCSLNEANDLPISISATEPSSITSELNVTEAGVIADVNLTALQGTHTNVTDLTFSLKSPSGAEVNLASALCGLNITIGQNGGISVNGADAGASFESSGAAAFGPNIPSGGITSVALLGEDDSANPNELCNAAVNAAQLEGNIALVFRGNCPFVDKVLNAQDVGAVAVIVINNIAGDGYFDMGGTSNSITIPSVMVSLEDGNDLVALSSMDTQDFNLSFDDEAQPGNVDCPPTSGQSYQPAEPLSAFNGENSEGIWTLTVTDNTGADGGELTGWMLNICFTGEDTGVKHYEAQSAFIYPNPTHEKLMIEMNGSMTAEHISVLDLLGRVLLSENVSGRKIIEINVSKYPSGVYLLRMDGKDTETKVFKFIKE